MQFSVGQLLFNRTLKLDITLVKASAYIEQDAKGRWVNLPTAKPKSRGLFKTEVEAIRAENVGAVLVPSPAVGQKTSAPISVSLKNGSVLFRDQNQRLLYELNGQFTNSDNFIVKADSLLPAAQTNVQLQGQNLPLPELVRLLKFSGIYLQKGLANGNLTVQLRENKVSGIVGTASFGGVQASIRPLKQIVQNSSGQLRFQGTNLIVDSLAANYGLIPLKIAGTVATGTNFNLQQASFNLTTNVQPVAFASVVSAVETELGQKVVLPVAVAGEVKADAKLTGTVAMPVLTGTIASTKPATVDRLQLNNISTNFKLERGRMAQTPTPNSQSSIPPFSSLALALSDILVVPAAGGKIGGKGEVDIALKSKNSPSGLVFDFQVENLPADALAQIYALPIPATVTIGSVSAKAQIFGPLDNIQARVQWQAPQGTFPAAGSIRAGRNSADLQNTVVKIGDASVNVDAALKDRQWQALIEGNRVALNSLQQVVPGLNLPPELAGLFSGTAEAAGTLDDLNLNAIAATGKGTLNIADSIVDVNGELESGRWQVSGNTEKVAVNQLIDIGLPLLTRENTANLDNLKSKIQNLKSLGGQLAGEFQAAGNVEDLTAVGINVRGNGRLNFADSNVNFKGELVAGNWQATAETDRTSINRLVDLGLPILDVASAFNPENQQSANLKSKIQNLKSIDGLLSSQFTASGSLDNLTASSINASGSGRLNLAGSDVNFKGELAAGNWQATAETDRTSISRLVNLGLPLLDVGLAFTADNPQTVANINNLKSKIQNLKSIDGQISNQIQASGSLDNSTVPDIAVNSSGQLNIGDGTVAFKGKLEDRRWQAFADADRVILSRLEETIRNTQLLTLTATLPEGFDGRVNGQFQAAGSLDNLTAKGISASGEARILADRLGAIDTTAKLENGNLQALLATNGIAVSNLEQTLKQTGLLTADLPPEINGTLDGEVRILGTVDNLTANGITANGDGQIRLANGGGIVNAKGRAESGNWRASIEGEQIALSRFQQAFESQQQSLQAKGLVSDAPNLPQLGGLFNGNINLSGPIAASLQTVRAGGSFRISELPFVKQPFEAVFNWDGKRVEIENATSPGLTANGFVNVELEGKRVPSISNLDLDVRLANFNLAALPAEQLGFLTPANVKNPSEKNQPVRGNVDFIGRLSGTPAALSLVGDVEVRDLAVNQIAFDPVLAGSVNADAGESVDVRLAGASDKIEVALNQSFLPTSFLIQRGESVASGRNRGRNFAS